jgi:hypothetical protein
VSITFNGFMTAGNVYALECKTAYCGAGCQPKLEHPLDFKPGGGAEEDNKLKNTHKRKKERCETIQPTRQRRALSFCTEWEVERFHEYPTS